MARSKVDSTPVLESFQSVDRHIRRIGEINIKVQKAEAEMNDAINKAKKKKLKIVEPLHSEKKRLEKEIEDFSIFHRDKFDKKKSMMLNFGKIGFRKSTKLTLLKGWKWDRVVAKLEELGLNEFLNIKKSVDKETVKNSGRTLAELKTWGVEVESTEEFYYDIDEAKIAQMPQMKVVSKAG